MSRKRYPEEFKIETVRQVADRGHSLYAWLKKYGPKAVENQAKADQHSITE